MSAWVPGAVILGEYTIERELGHGGMGRVWLVKSNSTGRRYAVKQTILKDEKTRKAFLEELQTWIDLPEHPNIVPCRFFRTVGDEIVIFTDYIEGGSLKDWIDQGKLSTLEQILDVAIQFAWGIHAIHERGLIHQDVKPGNVLMTAEGVPMVADFGLARARQVAWDGENFSSRQPNGQHSVLVPGSGFMTKAYASPEQKAGQPLSRKTDIWSWGVSVLDMFMGGVSCPHGGHIAAEVLEAFLENGGQEECLPKMPEGIADILRGCFQNDLPKRWAHLGKVVEYLKAAYLNTNGRKFIGALAQNAHYGKPPAGMAERRTADGGEWANPQVWLQRALLLSGRNPSEAKEIAKQSAHSRRGQLVKDLAVLDEAKSLYLSMIKQGRENMVADVANIYREKSFILATAADLSGALKELGNSIAILRRLVDQEGKSELSFHMAADYMNMAKMLEDIGNSAGAVNACDECISICRRLVDQDNSWDKAYVLAAAFLNKGVSQTTLGDLASAKKTYADCISILKKLDCRADQSKLASALAQATMNLAALYRRTGEIQDAVRLYDESLEIMRRLVEQEGRQELANQLAFVLMNKGSALQAKGEIQEAVKMYDESLEIMRRLVQQEGRQELADQLAFVLMNKGSALQAKDKTLDAVRLYDESIGIMRRLVEQEGRQELASHLASVLKHKASALESAGDLHNAVKLYDENIAIMKQLVLQKGRRDLLGDLCCSKILRANARQHIESLSKEDQWQVRCDYKVLANEAGRTGEKELRDVLAFAELSLTKYL